MTPSADPSPALSPSTSSLSPASRKPMENYRARIEAELRKDILPFWLEHTRDTKRGGFFGEISNDLAIKPDATRGALLTSRILWTFSAAYRRYHDAAYLEMARWAAKDLRERFTDKEHGGLFWSTTADGAPLDTHKQIYGQVFGIYALSEFYRATGDEAALDQARAIYRAVEEHARDREHGGYFEACSRDWKRLGTAERSVMGVSADKSQNTHLHVMEAYANLLRAWPDPGLRRDLTDLVEVMLSQILDPATHHLRLFQNADWTPRSDTISFGHDIEASWLLCEAAEVLDDAKLTARIKPVALEIAHAVLKQGVDADGGVLYEADPHGISDGHKEWWPQAEAVVGFLNAYQLSGEQPMLDAAFRSWDFIDAHLIDHKNGEWFNSVSRDDHVLMRLAKVSLWKCPYHNSRACFEAIDRLGALLGESSPAR
jgi:mannobiose 2-epimerase